MEIHQKRGLWFVLNPPQPKKTFESEKEALAYIKEGASPKFDDEDWEDDSELYKEDEK